MLDPHSYELVKGDDEKLDRADLIFYNGLGLEHGRALFLHAFPDLISMRSATAIMQKYPERILHKGPAIDPHIWMDISIWALAIEPIVCELSKSIRTGPLIIRAVRKICLFEWKKPIGYPRAPASNSGEPPLSRDEPRCVYLFC